MKFLLLLSGVFKKKKKSTNEKQEMFLKYGQEQFKTLIKKGLAIPVTLL